MMVAPLTVKWCTLVQEHITGLTSDERLKDFDIINNR